MPGKSAAQALEMVCLACERLVWRVAGAVGCDHVEVVSR